MNFCLHDKPKEAGDYQVMYLHIPGQGYAVGEPIYRSFDGEKWIGLREEIDHNLIWLGNSPAGELYEYTDVQRWLESTRPQTIADRLQAYKASKK